MTKLRAKTKIDLGGTAWYPEDAVFDEPDPHRVYALVSRGQAEFTGFQDLSQFEPKPKPSAIAVAEGERTPSVPEPPAPETLLSSVELKLRLALIDEARQRRREALAEAEALQAAAERELADLEARQELEGANVKVAITKAEASVGEKQRATRAKRVALDREIERTEEDRQRYESGLAQAIKREAQDARIAAQRALVAEIVKARRDELRAYAALTAVLARQQELGARASSFTVFRVDDLFRTLSILVRDSYSQQTGLNPRWDGTLLTIDDKAEGSDDDPVRSGKGT